MVPRRSLASRGPTRTDGQHRYDGRHRGRGRLQQRLHFQHFVLQGLRPQPDRLPPHPHKGGVPAGLHRCIRGPEQPWHLIRFDICRSLSEGGYTRRDAGHAVPSAASVSLRQPPGRNTSFHVGKDINAQATPSGTAVPPRPDAPGSVAVGSRVVRGLFAFAPSRLPPEAGSILIWGNSGASLRIHHHRASSRQGRPEFVQAPKRGDS
jgi:hypothetical protein